MDKWIRACRWALLLAFLAIQPELPAAEADLRTPAPAAPAPPSTPALAAGFSNSVPSTIGATNAGALDPSIRTMVAVQELIARQAEETLRSHLRLQEQLHSALLAIQRTRSEASAEAQTNVGAMLNRMEALEQELAAQRARDAEAARQSNRLMILAAGGIFFVGVLAMVLTVMIQARGMNRLAEIAVGLSQARGLPGIHDPLSLALPSNGNERMLLGAAGSGVESGDGRRLQSAMRQLEERIRDIESAAQSMPDAPKGSAGAGSEKQATERMILLAKAQAHLNLDQPEIALRLLEDAIARAPGDAELQLRRGMALERLKHLDPAIEAYDRAISIDARCTQAYLAKGGVLNRQARFQEALACYERALASRTQPGG